MRCAFTCPFFFLLSALILIASGCQGSSKARLPSLDDLPEVAPGEPVFRKVSFLEALDPLSPFFLKAGEEIVPVARAPRIVTREELEKGIRSDIETEREAAERRARETSWKQLRMFGTWCFVPGLALFVASFFFPFLKNVGAILLGLGVGLSVLPWIGQMILPTAVGPLTAVLAIGLAVGAAVLLYRLIFARGVNVRVEDIREQLKEAQASGDTQRARLHAAAIIALERMDNPKMDEGGWRQLPEARILNGDTNHE